MAWIPGTRLSNPNAGAVLFDTGPLTADRSWSPHVLVCATVAAQVLFQRRNAANDATLQEQIFPVAANQPFSFAVNGQIDVAEGERLRLVLNANITGAVQCSMFFW